MELYKYIFYGIRHWWYFLWIRKEKFHKSLEIDVWYIHYCKPKGGIQTHYDTLQKRRNKVYLRDINMSKCVHNKISFFEY